MAARLAHLAGARVVAQVLGLAWFLYAARELGAEDFGVLSAGLALVVVIGGFSDLGTTRSVVRHIAAEPASLRAMYVRAAGVRAASGLAIGGIAATGMRVLKPELSDAVIVLAAAIAIASGVTEVGFASLRSVGRVGTEVALLIGERLLFLATGVALLVGGHGPAAVLAAYFGTNLMSSIVISVVVRKVGDRGGASAGRLFDAEGRRTAASSTLVIVGPRVSVLILVLFASPTVLGAYTIAQKVPEALGTLATAALLPILPVLRAATVSGTWSAAVRRAGRLTTCVVLAIAPIAAWLVVDGRRGIDLLFGAADRRGVVPALAFLTAGALLWVVRTFGEVLLLAGERAADYLRSLVAGLVVNAALGVPFTWWWGAGGAAAAAFAGELAVLGAVLVLIEPERRAMARPVGALLGAGAVGALVAAGCRSSPLPVALVGVGAVAAAGTAVYGRELVRSLSTMWSPSAPAGHDTDVGAQVGRDLTGDGIEAVEHGAGPIQHL